MITNNIKLSAAITNPLLSEGIRENTGSEFLGKILPNFITLFLIVGLVVFFFILLIGAIQWITSGGDKAGIEAAKSKLTNALIGVLILLSSFAIIKLIEFFFDINIMTIDLGPLIIQ